MRVPRLFLALLLAALPVSATPRNVAVDAHASSSDSYSDGYLPEFAIDGEFPEMGSQDDVGRAWCVDGGRTGGQASFSFEWDAPVHVAEVIYYGRTCWFPNECFREYRVLVDSEAEPAATGIFHMNAGPQRVPIMPCEVSELTLEFPSSYGGNPGAVEIQVWTESPSDEALPDLKRLPNNVAMDAQVTASSEHSDLYRARYAVDGLKPIQTGGVTDVGAAWAVRGADWVGEAVFTLAWPEPTRVAELVYWGRTAFMLSECFGEFTILADGTEISAGTFDEGIGPQYVPLPEMDVRELTLRLRGSAGANPGAAEIEVFDQRVDRSAFPAFLKDGWRPPDVDPDLQSVIDQSGVGVDRLLLVRRHEINPSHVYTAYCEGFSAGGGLCVANLTQQPPTVREIVPSPEGQILDCDLSYDGNEVVFSWRRSPGDAYHVYSIGVDGSGLTQLTSGPWHDYNACWLPDGGVAFLSTRSPAVALCFTTPAGTLHRMERDGSDVRQLSFNYINDFTPSVLSDGRILYSRWEYVDKPAIPIQSLWTINPDGTGLSVFYGNRVLSPASFLEGREIPGTELVLCTLTAHNGPIRGGIGVVDRRLGINAQEALVNLTPQVDIGSVDRGDGNHVQGGFESPYPISHTRFLASGKGSIWVGETTGAWAVLLKKEGDLGWYNPQPIRPRPRPAERTGAPTLGDHEWSAFYLVDVYQGLGPSVQRGEIKRIAVIQEMAKTLRTEVLGFGFQRPVISCGAAYATKRIWGFVPVEDDGSAYFRVPPGVPLYFEALDAEGRAVQRMRSFTHLQPGETQGCIGCHEPRADAPPSAVPAAVGSEPSVLTPPPWGTSEFDYARMVQPILDRHCGACHGGVEPAGGVDLSGDRTDWFNVSYDVLTRGYANWIDTRNGMEHNIPMIEPRQWGSPASRLADLILDGHPDAAGSTRVSLIPDERQTILSWIDLNVPYYGTYLMADESAEGGRRVYPADLDSLLAGVAERRCVSCHDGGAPREGYVRIQNVERNSFLSAPLARSAGGRGVCGGVFASREDADYQALLASLRRAEGKLMAMPRMDMDGAVAAPCNMSLM